jgi:hypothetical protein
MHDHALFVQAVSGFTHWLLEPHASITVLERLTDRATAVLDLVGSGILLDIDGVLTFATALPEQVADLEEAQERDQQGPGVDAYRSGHVVTSPDLSVEDRWGGYAAMALARGLHATAGIPLRAGDIRVGAMSVYAASPREWLEDDIAALSALADVATGCLVSGSRQRGKDDLVRQLRGALESRVAIEQAKGFLAAQEGITVEEAFARIRRYARDHNESLRSVAAAVVRDRGLGGREGSGPGWAGPGG